MKSACRSFRTLLEERLRGRPAPRQLSELSWHEHLVGCAACRTLFETEEALEVLLATLPDPRLPPEVKRRLDGEYGEDREEGGKTIAWLARLSEDGPTGGYFHAGQPLPWQENPQH